MFRLPTLSTTAYTFLYIKMNNIPRVKVLEGLADLGDVVTAVRLHQLILYNLLKQLSTVQVLGYHHYALIQVENLNKLNNEVT